MSIVRFDKKKKEKIKISKDSLTKSEETRALSISKNIVTSNDGNFFFLKNKTRQCFLALMLTVDSLLTLGTFFLFHRPGHIAKINFIGYLRERCYSNPVEYH